ncbi:MAG: ATP-binding protein [Wujia sp.]
MSKVKKETKKEPKKVSQKNIEKDRRKKERREHRAWGISLRAFVMFFVIALCAGIMIVYTAITNQLFVERYREQLSSNLVSQAESLQKYLQANSMSLKQPENLNLYIEGMAKGFYGRVLIVDSEYRIIKDTYGTNVGNYMVDEHIFSVISGKTESCMEFLDGYVQYITAVKQDDQCMGAIMILASTENGDSLITRVKRKSAIVICLIMFVCVCVAWMIGNASSHGIKRINRQMERAGEGDWDAQMSVRGFKEFKQLTESYNKTLSRLKTIDSTRQEFVSNVSHELKTPITSMKVLADSLIQNEEADLPMYKEFMTDIVDEIDRESKIINDLLTLVKMDKQAAELNLAEVNINDLLGVILKRVTPIAKNRDIEITYESYRDVVANVDEVKLSLALTNIIENAVKYNVDHGWVKVTLNADHKNFHIKVADSGVGIPDDCKEHVFERFYRVDKARSRDTGGTGLGLAITRSVILMHRGSIKLYSESGEGTTFTIKIPMKIEDGAK